MLLYLNLINMYSPLATLTKILFFLCVKIIVCTEQTIVYTNGLVRNAADINLDTQYINHLFVLNAYSVFNTHLSRQKNGLLNKIANLPVVNRLYGGGIWTYIYLVDTTHTHNQLNTHIIEYKQLVERLQSIAFSVLNNTVGNIGKVNRLNRSRARERTIISFEISTFRNRLQVSARFICLFKKVYKYLYNFLQTIFWYILKGHSGSLLNQL